jgi:hypothetical protein
MEGLNELVMDCDLLFFARGPAAQSRPHNPRCTMIQAIPKSLNPGSDKCKVFRCRLDQPIKTAMIDVISGK